MGKHQYVIYIPGLGDGRVHKPRNLQNLFMKSWRLWGVEPILFQMNWGDKRPFATKIAKLLDLIDDLAAKGDVSLVSASAGATAALNAFSQRPGTVKGVVCIAGKINSPAGVSQSYKTRAPSFWEAAQQIEGCLDKLQTKDLVRVLSIRAVADPIVPARDSILAGAKNRTTWTAGHALTIGSQLLIGAPHFLRFLKNIRV